MSLNTLHSQVGRLFRNDWRAAAIELLIVTAGVLLWGFLPVPRTIVPFFIFAWISLWGRGISWREVGLCAPQKPVIIILIDIAVAAGAALAGEGILPALTRLTGEGPLTSAYQFLRGNLWVWLGLVAATWLLAALLEEMVFRGYIMNRLADLVGRSRLGWVVSLLGASLVFTLSHGQYSLRFLLTGFLMGTLEGGMYLAWKRNLWIAVVIHGVADTITLTLVFLGLV